MHSGTNAPNPRISVGGCLVPMATIYHLLDEHEPFSESNGGAISRWAANTLRDGTEIIVCPSFDGSWKFPADRIYKMPGWERVASIHPLVYRLPWMLQKAYLLRVFTPLLRRLNPGDLIYVHNRPAYAAVLATVAERHKARVVLHMHNSLLLRANRGQIKALREVPIVFVSDFLRKETERAIPKRFERTSIVYNGADEKRFYPHVREVKHSFNVIFTGRLVHYKGIHVLLEAMRILEKQGVKANCKIVGGSGFGNNKDSRYVRQLKRDAPSNCELVGYRSGEVFSELLQNSDVFCCPSIWNDPFPLAPLEGMASGLPIVASNVGGLAEALAYGGGILIPPSNPRALAEALGSLAKDEGRCKELGKEAREAVEKHFFWSNVRAQYLSAVQGLQP
jgi:spore coat protein SA